MSERLEPEIEASDSEAENPSMFKPFLEHLEDFRRMLIKMIVALAAAMFLSFWFARELLAIIIWPLKRTVPDPSKFLWTFEVTGGFMLALKLAFYAGIALSCPLLLYFLGEFILPALTPREKRLIGPVLASGVLLFLGGAALAYFIVIPAGLRFFIKYNEYLGIGSLWTIGNYTSFVSQMVLAFGLCFELPLVVLVLAKLGVVSHAFLKNKRPYVIIIIFVLAAVVTPTTDPFNQTLLAAPMVVLYEICIWITRWTEWKQARRLRRVPSNIPANPAG